MSKSSRPAGPVSWTLTRVDGKIASVSNGYKGALRVLESLVHAPYSLYSHVSCDKVSTEELFAISARTRWEDLLLFGTLFRKRVWKALFDLTHGENAYPRILSYSEFAEIVGEPRGVRSVASAVGNNPVPVIIPCHLIIPKESLDKLRMLERENGLFSWHALYVMDSSVDYGEYSAEGASAKDIKRDLIHRQFAEA